MSDDYDQSMEDGGVIPDPDPRSIAIINEWLDDATDFGTDVQEIINREFRANDLAIFAGCTVPEASQMLQDYRTANYWMDQRCHFVIAHEGHYGPRAPWRIQSTTHDIPETTRRVYRLNQIRHVTWDFVDHARKEIKSFGAEIRQAVVQVDATTTSAAADRQRLAIRDYVRDLLQNMRTNAAGQGADHPRHPQCPSRPTRHVHEVLPSTASGRMWRSWWTRKSKSWRR